MTGPKGHNLSVFISWLWFPLCWLPHTLPYPLRWLSGFQQLPASILPAHQSLADQLCLFPYSSYTFLESNIIFLIDWGWITCSLWGRDGVNHNSNPMERRKVIHCTLHPPKRDDWWAEQNKISVSYMSLWSSSSKCIVRIQIQIYKDYICYPFHSSLHFQVIVFKNSLWDNFSISGASVKKYAILLR